MANTPSATNTNNGTASILIIEEDTPTARFLPLQPYFESLGWVVNTAHTGGNALAQIEQGIPDAVLLNPALPDLDGFEICRRIRANFKTQLLPVIFSHPADRDTKLKGLSSGADGHQEVYIINDKIYFDPEGLKLNILQLAASSKGYGRLAITDLPTRDFTESRISELMQHNDWALLDIRLGGFDEFEDAFGFLAAYDLLRMGADLIKNVLLLFGLDKEFVGHLETNRFIIMVPEKQAKYLNTKLKERFFAIIPSFLSSIEQDLGGASLESSNTEPFDASLLNLAIGMVLGSEQSFSDLKSLLNLATERLRADQANPINFPVRLIEQYIQTMRARNDWALLSIELRHFDAFCEIYDEAAARNATLALQGLIAETLSTMSPDLQFMDRTEDNRIWLITFAASAPQIREHLKRRFADIAFAQYYYIHQQEGFIRRNNGDQVPLMDLAIGSCIPGDTMDTNAILKMAEDSAKSDPYTLSGRME